MCSRFEDFPDILEEAHRINKGNVLGPLDDGSPHSPEGSHLIIGVCGKYGGTQVDDHGNAKDNHHRVQNLPLEGLLIVQHHIPPYRISASACPAEIWVPAEHRK